MKTNVSFITVSVNLSEKSLLKYYSAATKGGLTDKLRRAVLRCKQELLNEFNNHPVTIEIDGGIYSENLSGTLSGYGNLYTFIGFDSKNPTDVIRRKIKNIRVIVSQRGNVSSYKIIAPRIEKIFQDTPVPWASRSWAKGVETGLPHIAKYIHKPNQRENSRTKSANIVSIPANFARKSKIRRFKPVSYISKMINNFYKNLERSINNI